MKISLDRLKQEQKIFLEKEILKLDNMDLREYSSGEIEVSLTLSWIKSTIPTIGLKGDLIGNIQLICDRCAELFIKKLNYKMNEVYELERDEILKKTIDIETKIKDFITNNFPIKILCKESCKGICIKCNTNLNKEPCKCKL